jgi:transposase InsO family protein
MHTEIITSAIEMAVKRQGLDLENESLITHSDRGSQYASEEYRDKLAEYKITASSNLKKVYANGCNLFFWRWIYDFKCFC